MLSIENLTVKYGTIPALTRIHMHVNRGEIVSLIGSNGAGKTTLIRTLSGLIKATQGKIIFANQIISQKLSHEIVKLGISQSPEGRMVFPDMTVKENLMMGSYALNLSSAEMKKNLDQMLDWFPRLNERLMQKAILLSGGEQQMLAIARALMAQPSLLLLDEPSLGIAPLITHQIFDIMTEINRQGVTILLAEQNAHLALKVSHRAYVLELGEIVKEDDAHSLLNDNDVKRAYLGIC